MLVLAFAMAVVVIAALAAPVFRHLTLRCTSVLHEVDRLTARVVFATVLSQFYRVQVERAGKSARVPWRRAPASMTTGCGKQDGWSGQVADFDVAIEPG